MRWAELVARMGEVFTGFGWGNLRESHTWKTPGLNGKIILK